MSVPALVYRTVCLACQAAFDFPIFDGGGFCAFVTYRGAKTGEFYRMDAEQDLLEAVAHATAHREDGIELERVPDEMTCPRCGAPAGLPTATLETVRPRESTWDAIILP